MDFEDIRYNLKDGLYDKKQNVPKPKRTLAYPSDFIFDENQTVKWNKEKVVVENKRIKRELEQYRKKLNMGYEMLKKDIKQAVKESLPTAFDNETNIALILTDALDMDEFGSMVNRAEELCDFVYSLELNKA